MRPGGGGARGALEALAISALALACGSGPELDAVPELGTSVDAPPAPRDLADIRESAMLRVLVPPDAEERHLPRVGLPYAAQRERASEFARELGVDVEWVPVESFAELIDALALGRGDLAVDNLTVTPERQARVAFSAPVAFVREQVVTRAGDVGVRSPEDLAGRRIAVRPSSSYWRSAEALRGAHPGIGIEAAPDSLAVDEILARVAEGVYDVTLADSNLVAPVRTYRDDLRVAFDLDGERVIAWALQPGARELRRAVDEFLTRRTVRAGAAGPHTDDLPGLRERGVLRLLTRNNAASYYVWRGELMGFEYELAREFAKRQGLELEVVVPPAHGDLLGWLREGRGDLVAASLTATPERATREKVAFSRKTNRTLETVVARREDAALASIADLAGRRLHVRRDSHYWETLEGLRASGIALELVPAGLETEEIVDRVAAGEYDLTLADGHIVDIELTWRDDVRAALEVGEPVEHGWAVRADNPKLLAAVNAFFDEEYRGVLYNVLRRRYFDEPKRIRAHADARPARAGRISPFDSAVQRHAAAHGFDWRLIAAQMHQESRFDPSARSPAGARGLLQVMPRTARELGVGDLDDPNTGIAAGVRYLALMRGRLGEELPASERTWLALASYNVGYGHVRDARELASARGWDPDRWFGHVERAILLKRHRDVAARTRFGWCRCNEPVRYVRAIRERYRAYVQVADLAPRVATGWPPAALSPERIEEPPAL
jgi:membrane-bound lytic murein transglycosylase F